MENTNLEITKTEEDTVLPKMQVLSIGDKEEDSIEDDTPPSKSNSKDEFADHLRYLLLESYEPVKVVVDWNLVGRFGASAHNRDKKPSYSFYYSKELSYTPDSIINGPVISGREVMDDLKQRLKDEHWISKNEISTPLKAKLESKYHNHNHYIQSTVSDAIDSEKKRLLNYILFLHRQHVK